MAASGGSKAGNPEREKEERAKAVRDEKRFTMYLGQSSAELQGSSKRTLSSQRRTPVRH